MKSKRFFAYLHTSGSAGAGLARSAILVWATLSAVAFAGCNDLPSGWQCIDSARDCDPGYTCTSVQGGNPRCYQVCSVGDSSTCHAGEGCSEADPEGICLPHSPACEDHGSCWSGFECNERAGQCVKCADNGGSPDCRDPMAPVGLLATPGVQQVELSWERVRGATRYHIFVAHEPGVTEDSTEIADIADTTYVHTYLDPATTYYYRVSAENPWAEGPLSGEVDITPLPPPPEEAPGSVAATPGDTQVEVTWASVVDADGYHLYWDTTAGGSGNVVDDAESPYLHAGLDNGTSYYYRVSAYNAGGEGPVSVEVSAVPQVPAPGAPRNLTAVAGDGSVTLTWTELADASSYIVYWDTESPVDTNSVPLKGVHGSPYVHLGRANGTTYYYRVSAMNPGGESAMSSQVSATPQPPAPSTPAFLEAEAGSREVALSWASVSGADTYELFWDTQPGVTTTDGSVSGIAATSFTHTGLSNSATYYYRVRARNGGGVSNLSLEALAAPEFQVDAQQKLVPSDSDGRGFGSSVAISGTTMVVGAKYDNDGASGAGAAYVFDWSDDGWQQVQKLVATDAQDGDRFGVSVAISGDSLVVSAEFDGDVASNAGAVYIFARTEAGWVKTQKLVADDGDVNDFFGDSVAISGNYIAVGAFGEDEGGDGAGAAYVFERGANPAWLQAAKLIASDAQEQDSFGYSVAISGGHLVVGADGEDAGGSDAGAAYVFDRTGDGWIERQKLVSLDPQAGDQLGLSVAISGSYLVAGALTEDSMGNDAGSAYVFNLDGITWKQATKLVAGDAATGDLFGSSVAVDGDYVLVGAVRDGGTWGAAYLFQSTGSGWQQIQKLVASDAHTSQYFGESVAINGDHLVVGTANLGRECYTF